MLCLTPFPAEGPCSNGIIEALPLWEEAGELSDHRQYIFHYHTMMCPQFMNGYCPRHKASRSAPPQCFCYHFESQRRRPLVDTLSGQLRYWDVLCERVAEGLDCPSGDLCPFSHTREEISYHAAKYKTKLCNDRDCRGQEVCCFAHGEEELRTRAIDQYSFWSFFGSGPAGAVGLPDGQMTASPAYDLAYPGCELVVDTSGLAAGFGMGGRSGATGALYHPKVYKHRFCASYPNVATCRRGESCAFAHTREEIRTPLLAEEEEMQRPHALTNDFFMYKFKTLWCPIGVQHDWQTCVYAHNYQDARRHPAIGYGPRPCPYWKRKETTLEYSQRCPLGVRCSFSHGAKEQLYHPAYFKTVTCQDWPNSNCPRRQLCAFWHKRSQQRSRPRGADEAFKYKNPLAEDRVASSLQNDFLSPPFKLLNALQADALNGAADMSGALMDESALGGDLGALTGDMLHTPEMCSMLASGTMPCQLPQQLQQPHQHLMGWGQVGNGLCLNSGDSYGVAPHAVGPFRASCPLPATPTTTADSDEAASADSSSLLLSEKSQVPQEDDGNLVAAALSQQVQPLSRPASSAGEFLPLGDGSPHRASGTGGSEHQMPGRGSPSPNVAQQPSQRQQDEQQEELQAQERWQEGPQELPQRRRKQRKQPAHEQQEQEEQPAQEQEQEQEYQEPGASAPTDHWHQQPKQREHERKQKHQQQQNHQENHEDHQDPQQEQELGPSTPQQPQQRLTKQQLRNLRRQRQQQEKDGHQRDGQLPEQLQPPTQVQQHQQQEQQQQHDLFQGRQWQQPEPKQLPEEEEERRRELQQLQPCQHGGPLQPQRQQLIYYSVSPAGSPTQQPLPAANSHAGVMAMGGAHNETAIPYPMDGMITQPLHPMDLNNCQPLVAGNEAMMHGMPGMHDMNGQYWGNDMLSYMGCGAYPGPVCYGFNMDRPIGVENPQVACSPMADITGEEGRSHVPGPTASDCLEQEFPLQAVAASKGSMPTCNGFIHFKDPAASDPDATPTGRPRAMSH